MAWNEFRSIKDIEVEKDGKTRYLTAEVCVTLDRIEYGADADGRRGEMRDVVTSWEYESIYDVETGHLVTHEFKNNADVERAVLKSV